MTLPNTCQRNVLFKARNRTCPKHFAKHIDFVQPNSIVLQKHAMLATLEMCDKVGFSKATGNGRSSGTKNVSAFGGETSNSKIEAEISNIKHCCEHQELRHKAQEVERVYCFYSNMLKNKALAYRNRALALLQEQRKIRPVQESQIATALQNIDSKFNAIEMQLEKEALLKLQSLKQSVISVRLKKRTNLPKSSISLLRGWMMAHFSNPYPSDEEKLALASAAAISVDQVNNWFINARVREWKPLMRKNQGRTLTRAPPTVLD